MKQLTVDLNMNQPTTTSSSLHQVVTALCRRDTNKARSVLAQALNSGAATKNSAFGLVSEGLIGLSQSLMDGLPAKTSSLILLAEGCVMARMNDDGQTIEQVEKLMKAWPPLGFSAYPVVFGQVATRALSRVEQSVRFTTDSDGLNTDTARDELRIKHCTDAVMDYLRGQRLEPVTEAQEAQVERPAA